MISLQDYNHMTAGEKKDYLDSLSTAEKEQFFHKVKAANPSTPRSERVIPYGATAADAMRAAATRRDSATPWSRNQMGLMVCWILFFPLTGLVFFIASAVKDATREQGFTLLKFSFVYMFLLLAAGIALSYYLGDEAVEVISAML